MNLMIPNIKGAYHVKEIGEIDSLFSAGVSFDYLYLHIPAVVLGGSI